MNYSVHLTNDGNWIARCSQREITSSGHTADAALKNLCREIEKRGA